MLHYNNQVYIAISGNKYIKFKNNYSIFIQYKFVFNNLIIKH